MIHCVDNTISLISNGVLLIGVIELGSAGYLQFVLPVYVLG